MPLGEEWRGFGSFWGQVVRKYLERDLQTFTGIVTFRFSFRFSILFFIFCSYYIQHCFICRPSDSTVPTDAGIEPRTVATGALAVRRSNH
jgi:hypothetical protein